MSVKQRLNQHQQRTANDEHQPQCRFFRQLFVEYEVRERDGHKDTQLVDRHYHAGRAVLQRLVVAQPTPAGGKAGQHQKQQRFSADASDGILRADNEHHQPRKGQHHYGADGGGHGGIRLADAAFGQNGCQTGEQRRTEGRQYPHDLSHAFPAQISLPT